MQQDSVTNIHIRDEQVLLTPEQLRAQFPIEKSTRAAISQARETVADIIHKRDHRLLVVCGPCSIHDVEAAKDYARRLKACRMNSAITCLLLCGSTLKNRAPPLAGKG